VTGCIGSAASEDPPATGVRSMSGARPASVAEGGATSGRVPVPGSRTPVIGTVPRVNVPASSWATRAQPLAPHRDQRTLPVADAGPCRLIPDPAGLLASARGANGPDDEG
jgi:hypothetical protein